MKAYADQDAFTQGNLNANVNWTGWEVVPGIWLLIILILVINWYNQRESVRASLTLFVGMAVFITLTLWFFIGRIEGISQAAAMRFFERAQGQDVYVKAYGYHSYGPYFYTRKPAVTNPNYYNDAWLLRGRIDKDVLFIRKAAPNRPCSTPCPIQENGEKKVCVLPAKGEVKPLRSSDSYRDYANTTPVYPSDYASLSAWLYFQAVTLVNCVNDGAGGL